MSSLRLLIPILLLFLGSALLAQPAKPRTASSGLTGTYYAGENFERKVFTRIDPAIDFKWWQTPPGPGLESQYYSVRWLGRLFTPATGSYRFSVEVDDGVRVWVGGRKIIDAWGLHNNDRFESSIDLIANRYYDLRVDYSNAILEGEIKLYWVIPDESEKDGNRLVSAPRQLIETNYFGREPVRLAATAKPKSITPKPRPSAPPPAVEPTTTPVAARQQVEQAARAQPVPTSQRASAQPVSETTAAPAVPVFDRLTAGETVVLRHVFFEQSDYRLLPTSYAELDKLVRTLQQQPTLRIEIAGHTDNQGDPRLNLALSENRAKVVANYLMRHGINEDRLEPKGYGGSRPLTDNAGESARAQNRRVEFIVR